LAETRRVGGRVQQVHVAALGAIDIGLLPADRIAFWTKLHQRLDALSNRVDAAQRGTILAAIHARIPMPTLDDQQTVQLERAREDVRFWEMLAGSYADDIEGRKELLASMQRAIAAREPLAADTATKAQAAKDRLARVEKGEAVDGIGAPLIRKDILKITGWSEGYLRHCEQVAEIAGLGGFQLLLGEQQRRREKAERAVVRELHRMIRPS
jgi:hypothetical protein